MVDYRRRPLAAPRLALFAALATLSLLPDAASAQVSGTVVIRSGPVQGAVVVGEPVLAPRPVVVYQPVYGRRVVAARYLPQPVVVVPKHHGRHGKSARWYARHGYQPVTLYYSQGVYFTQVYAVPHYRWAPQFVPVLVWERGGRFYLPAGAPMAGPEYVSSYQPKSSRGYQYEYEEGYPGGDGRDWDD